ncbi:MAG TPA: glycosyltransferase [Thermoanaerobaculia bacterium]|jgi:glycosyltransferase involved in cell wall biosynthesis|nr:glycosyltransferase [Thermoanaerobaculia bacterium]
MKKPFVSLILLSYNYEPYIGDAIQSVLDQTYPHWELIVVDDASTDRSLEVIRSFSDPRIRLLRRKRNAGPSASYNHAYARCRGQYVGSLDADDFLAPRKLELQVGHFETHPDLDVLGTFVTEVDAAGHAADNGTAAWFNQDLDLDDVENWLMQNHLCHSSALLRRSTHDRLGLLNPHLRVASDYELWLRGLTQGSRFQVLNEPLLFSRQHGSNAWRKVGRSDLFLELAYLFSAHLARHLAGRSQVELIHSCVSFFNIHFLAAATDDERDAVAKELLNFSRHPRDFAGFAAAFERGCGPHWPAILDAIDPDRDRAPLRDSARSWLGKLTMPWRRRPQLGEEDDTLVQVESL